jgi:hypothetical protein
MRPNGIFGQKGMSGRRRWTKKAEKEYEREERELAEKKAKGRIESEKRQVRIKVLWQELESGRLAKETDKEVANTELVRSLVELVEKQRCEIRYLTQFRSHWEEIDAHYPEQLETLSSASFHAGMRSLVEKHAEQKPKNFEDKRHGYKLSSGVGLIEYQFGGAGEAERQRHSLSGPLGLPYEPTCLDKIFAGGRLKMHEREGEMMSLWSPGHRIREPGLQNLFGMHRNRFPKNLPTAAMVNNDNGAKKDRRETWYDYRAVVETMRALLLEQSGEAKGSARLWLRGDPVRRTRVLSGIAARIDSLSVSGVIARAFLRVVRQYLPDSAKK